MSTIAAPHSITVLCLSRSWLNRSPYCYNIPTVATLSQLQWSLNSTQGNFIFPLLIIYTLFLYNTNLYYCGKNYKRVLYTQNLFCKFLRFSAIHIYHIKPIKSTYQPLQDIKNLLHQTTLRFYLKLSQTGIFITLILGNTLPKLLHHRKLYNDMMGHYTRVNIQ